MKFVVQSSSRKTQRIRTALQRAPELFTKTQGLLHSGEKLRADLEDSLLKVATDGMTSEEWEERDSALELLALIDDAKVWGQ